MSRAALVLLCCGCSLGGQKPQYDYFVLAPSHATRRASTADLPTVDVTDVTLPTYLDRDAIVTRVDENRLVYSTRDRWAEPLDQAFERTLRQELAARLHDGPSYGLHVDVLRFERRGLDRVELWARWRLHAEGEPSRTGESRFTVSIAGSGNDAVAAALSGAIARLAAEIAERAPSQPGWPAAESRRSRS